MDQTSLSAIREALRRHNEAAHREISKASGVKFDTLRKIAYGVTKNPRYETWTKLERWFRNAS